MRLVWNKDYDAEALKGYKKAEVSGSDDLTWGLYYSKNTASLPVTTFKFTHKPPCSLTDTLLSDPGQESANKWMSRDKYAPKCPYEEIESRMQESYRAIGSDFTINELDLLTKLSAIGKTADLKKPPVSFQEGFKKYKQAKAKNDLTLWQKPANTWSSSCQAQTSMKDFSI